MLKKVILGILGFILVVIAGAAAYIYTLDWNKHKALVSQRLTQITGLKSQINGNLRVQFFPTPKITAGRVSLFPNGGSTPLVEINEIAANLELKPLLNNNFIIKSMTLTQPTVNIIISENGELNWKNVGKNSNNKSGNVEMSFNDVRLNGATITYNDKRNNKGFSIPNITASVSAPSLTGPYKTNGKFIHNNSEIKFNGNILKNPNIKLKLAIDNAATGSKLDIDGEIGAVAKGNLTFDTRSLTDTINVIFGENTFNNNYKEPLFVSFQYDYNNGIAKLDNFNIKYSNGNVGNGNVFVKTTEGNKEFAADFNMAQFDLTFLENLSRDYIRVVKENSQAEKGDLSQYSGMLNLKAVDAVYKETVVQNLAMELSLKDSILGLTRFSALFPGETNVRTVGKVNLKGNLQFVFNQVIDSKDLRTFASVFGLNLLKLTSDENKKSVFKNAKAELKASGDLETLKISIPQATIDATDFGGNLGFISNEGNLFVLADIKASKILFDKYMQAMPDNMKKSSLKEKFIYQMNLIPWDKKINVEADISLASAVYNKIPMEKINLQFVSQDNQLNVKALSFENFAGAQLNTTFTANNIYTEPAFEELTYAVKTSNFPYFASTLGIETGKKDLFKRKIFASQGSMTGTFEAFNLSTVQKFGETEFSYTGAVSNPKEQAITVNGDLEFKSNNAANLIKALNFEYTPDVPATSFTATGKLKGSYDIFEYRDIEAYLGANNINGYIQLDNSGDKPILKSELSFNKFDVSRWFKLDKKDTTRPNTTQSPFINLPTLDNNAIDYTFLGKANFDIKATASLLLYNNKTYSNAALAAKLKDGILNVESFKIKNNGNDIALNFILDTANKPTVDGKYHVAGYKTPTLGGSVYRLNSGLLNADGTFNSSAYSKKEFFENLNSAGKFQLTDTAMRGWDLDIIKFDLEQRKDTIGFENAVAQNLQTGQSIFNKISGDYKINKGVIVADKVLWESPVVDMNMQLNLNLSDKLFTAVFGVIYHNASFSDILKFTMKGELSNPVMELDLSESIKRLSETEKQLTKVKENEFKERREKLSGRITSAQADADFILKEINNILRTAEKYKPVSNSKTVAHAYSDNIKSLHDMENKIKALQNILANSADDKAVIDAESKLGIEKSKLKYIPKALEDNFITDSKNAYDETLNKIIWLYNTASNNSAYYNDLTDVYIQQMETLKNAEKPLSAKEEDQLVASIKKISKDMEKIEKLHTKIRGDYLFIMDVTNVSEMQDNNTAVHSTLRTMLSYVKQLNKDIIDSLQIFRKTLEMKPRDDTEYLVFPPQNADDINTSQPTVKTPSKKKKVEQVESKSKELKDTNATDETTINKEAISVETGETAVKNEDDTDKKKIEALTKLHGLSNGIGQLMQKLNPLRDNSQTLNMASSLNFGGLSQILASTKEKNDYSDMMAEETAEHIDVVQDVSSAETVPATTDVEINLAEQDIVEPESSDVSIAAKDDKHQNTNETTKFADSTTNIQKQQKMINAKEATLQEVATRTDAISNLVEKTQTALNDILTEVRKSEQQIQTEVAKQTKTEETPAAPIIDIAKYTIPTAQTKSTNLKRNPVIAMNIGKELSHKQNINFGQIVRKGVFKSKKDKFGNVLKALPAADNPKVSYIAAKAVSSKDTNDLFNINISNIVTETAQNIQPIDKTNTYLFVLHTPTTALTGIVGKSITNHQHATPQPQIKQRYLFAANDVTFNKPHGSVSKKTGLTVK